MTQKDIKWKDEINDRSEWSPKPSPKKEWGEEDRSDWPPKPSPIIGANTEVGCYGADC